MMNERRIARERRRGRLVVGTGLAGLCLLTAGSFAEVPTVQAPPENPITEAKRVLGKILFWEEQLSSDNTVACGTCHIPSRNGADPRLGAHPGADGTFNTADDVIASPGLVAADSSGAYERDDAFGLDAQVTGRSAQPAHMAMYSRELFWDGRAADTFRDPVTDEILIARGGALESQAVGPPLSDVEMAHASRDWAEIEQKLVTAAPLVLAADLPDDVATAIEAHESYPALFSAAFGDEDITAGRIAFAIATYERTLVADQTPWDRFRAGDTSALTGAALRGWNAFQARQNACSECHEAPLFTDDSFRNIGLRPVSEDVGRQEVTGNNADRGRFKVPSLRNVGLKRTFMHTGRLSTLEDVLRFYAQAPGTQQFTDNRDPLIGPIRLPPPVQADIVAFLRTGLTDPRVQAETFPFDRPTLHSERATRNPLLTEAGVAGAGGRTPRMIAVSPPNVGNVLFQLGVDNGLPGAVATLVRSSSPPSAGSVPQDEIVAQLTLNGSGAGDGHGAAIWAIPNDAETVGDTLYFQWRIDDAAAPGGVALSRVARVTLEGRVIESVDPIDPDPPVEPEPVPVAANDESLYASKATYVVNWKSHAKGEHDDALTLVAQINPRGATGAAGAIVTVTIGDEELITTSGLSSKGVGAGTTEEGVSYKAKLDVDSGKVTVRLRGLDLREVTAASDADGAGTSSLEVALSIEGIGLQSPEASGALEFAQRTRAGIATKAKFRFRSDRATDGAFAIESLTVKRRSSGAYGVALKAALALEGGVAAHPTGPVLLYIGGAEPIEIAPEAIELSTRGSRASFAYDRRALAVAHLDALTYHGAKRQLKLVVDEIDLAELPEVGTLTADLDIRIEIPLEAGTSAYESTVRLSRGGGSSRKWRR